jgi:hypothetical protein
VVVGVHQRRGVRVGLIVGAGHADVDTRHEAVAKVGVHRVVVGVGFPLDVDGVAEMRHGRQCDGHRGGGHIAGVAVGRRHGRVGGVGSVGSNEDLVGSRVCGVVEHGRSVGALAVVVDGSKDDLIVGVHGRSELSVGSHGLERRGLLGDLLCRGALGSLCGRGAAGGRAALLLVVGLVRGSSAALEVFQTTLKLLAC